MRKFRNVLLSLALAFVFVLTLASCSKVSQSYADKINEAAKTEEKITYADAKDALGDECWDWTASGLTGFLYAVKGYKSTMTAEELDKKFSEADENTKFEVIVITVAAEKCVSANYFSGTGAEIEAKLTEALGIGK